MFARLATHVVCDKHDVGRKCLIEDLIYFRPFKFQAVKTWIKCFFGELSHAKTAGSSFCRVGRVKLQNKDPRSNAFSDAKRYETGRVFVL